MTERVEKQSSEPVRWIAADWGTSNLRLWIMGDDGNVLARIEDERGMGVLERSGFEPVLAELTRDFAPQAGRLTVVACGMVGAREGWVEAGYVGVPSPPPGGREAKRAEASADFQVFVLPGMKQAMPPDVMRGEETQIAGFLAEEPGYSGTILLPGTHSKWVRCEAGSVVSFATVMTGELFALLSRQSVLRHSLGADAQIDDETFDRAAAAAVRHPDAMMRTLFAVRAGSVLDGASPRESRTLLSGALIGTEIGAQREAWSACRTVIVGAGSLASLYEKTLKAAGAEVRAIDAEAATLRGLRAAYETLKEARP